MTGLARLIPSLSAAGSCTVLSALLMAFSFSQLSGQILRVKKSTVLADSADYWTGYVALNASINNGNSTADEQITFTSFRGTGDVSFTSEEHVYFLIGDMRYFQSTGGPLQSTGYGHLRANFERKQRLSYELFAQAQYDQGRNLDRRLLIGGGLRYRLLPELAIGTGIMQEYELWELPDVEGVTTDRNLTKSTSYVSGRIRFSEQVNSSLTAYFQTGYDPSIEAMRHRLSGDVSFAVRMGKKLSLDLRYSITYEERPIIPLSRTVYVFGSGLRYTL